MLRESQKCSPTVFLQWGHIPVFHCKLVMDGHFHSLLCFRHFRTWVFHPDTGETTHFGSIKLSRSLKLSRDGSVAGAFLQKEPTPLFIRHYKSHPFRGKGEQPFDVARSERLAEGSKVQLCLDGKCSGTCNTYTKPAAPWLNKVSSKWLAHWTAWNSISLPQERWRVSWSCQGFKFVASWPQNVTCIPLNKPAQWLDSNTWFSGLLLKRKKKEGGIWS